MKSRLSATCLILTLVSLIGLVGSVARSDKSDFRITDIERDGSDLRIGFQSDSNSYYTLYYGRQATDIVFPFSIGYGEPDFSSLPFPALGAREEEIRSGGGRTWDYPLNTFYHDARTQVIYHNAELGGAGPIHSLAFNVTTIPGQALSNLTIRAKHTADVSYVSPAWDDLGWTVAFRGDVSINTTGWVAFAFQTPFAYDGSNNLMIDISFDNASYSTAGRVETFTDPAARRSLSFSTDSFHGDPLAWAGGTPPGAVSSNVPVARIGFGAGMSAYFRIHGSGRATPADADGDGFDDMYELEKGFLDPLRTDSPRADQDGDGASDMAEYRFGTDPLAAGETPDMNDPVDSDGDGYPDVYEAVHGEDMHDRSSVPAATIYVGPPSPPATAVRAPSCSTIQDAIDMAVDYDIIEVRDGVYTGDGNRSIDFGGKRLILRSEKGPSSCVVDGEGDYVVGFSFQNGESNLCRLVGLTIRGMYGYEGGGVKCVQSSPVLRDCVLTDNAASYGAGAFIAQGSPIFDACTFSSNTASSSGGGVYCGSLAAPIVSNCTFVGNTADSGGGVSCYRGNAIVSHCTISGNTARSGGGGFYGSYGAPVLNHCTLTGNAPLRGGGMYLYSCAATSDTCSVSCNSAGTQGGGGVYSRYGNPTFSNVTITDNLTPGPGGGLHVASGSSVTLRNCTVAANRSAGGTGGGIHHAGSGLVVGNGILWGNSPDALSGPGSAVTITYSTVTGGWTGKGNSTNDPLLTATHRLLALSPCIDAGSASNAPPRDVDDEDRWDHPGHSNVVSIVDMGADEFVDVNSNGIADAWELMHFGDLSQDGTADDDADGGPDGLTDREEYRYGTDPDRADTDGDGLTDGEEVNVHGTSPTNADSDGDGLDDRYELDNGLDPNDPADAEADTDGDRYPTAYEYAHGSNPNSVTSVPAATVYVNAAAIPGGDGSEGSPFSTIQDGIDAAQDFGIIRLSDGVYKGNGNRGLDFRGKTIIVESASGAESCIIDAEHASSCIRFTGGEGRLTIVDGSTLRNGSASWGGGIYFSGAGPTIRNCIIQGCSASQNGAGACCTDGSPLFSSCRITGNEAAVNGGAFYLDSPGTAEFWNCTIVGNRAQSGGGIYDTGSDPLIGNSILYGNVPDAIAGSGSPTVTYSVVEGGWPGVGNGTNDPLLTAAYRPRSVSPCIDAGSASNAPPQDIDGEDRWDDRDHSNVVSIVDIGADEFVDVNSNGIADAWEVSRLGDLSQDGTADDDADGGPDGLTDREEYRYGTDPEKADTDGDGLTDGEEVDTHGTSPVNPDTDGDGMDDGYEVRRALDPNDGGDAPLDPDADGYPNAYEGSQDTDPHSSASAPSGTIHVAASAVPGGDGSTTHPFDTIRAAIQSAGAYDIIQVADGTYRGAGNRDLSPSGLPVMMRSTNGHAACIIDCEGKGHGFTITSGEGRLTIIEGLTVRNGRSAWGGGVYCSGAGPTLRNCVIEGCSASQHGAGAYCTSGSPLFSNCTITDNSAVFYGGALYLGSPGTPELRNCTIVDNRANNGGGIYNSGAVPRIGNTILYGNVPDTFAGSSSPTVTYSVVEGGWAGIGNSSNNPLLTATHRLRADSPCIDAGSASNAPPRDADGEDRWDDRGHSNAVSIVDIGADEFVDVNSNGIADAWEIVHLGGLSQDGSADDDTDGGPDGLTDREEYRYGTDPEKADTDGDGLTDGEEVKIHGTSPLSRDSDGDGMDDKYEVDHGLDPLDPLDPSGDPDGDGYPSIYEWRHGSDAQAGASIPVPIVLVDAGASPGGDGSPALPFNRIQDALDAAADYDVIGVGDGLYLGLGNRDLSYDGKPLILQSENGPSNCVIDCQGRGRGFVFGDGVDTLTIVDGLTIRNGSGASGGGIYCSGSTPVIRNCVIEDCTATEHGGGLYAGYRANVSNCTIVGNAAGERGGGVYGKLTYGELTGCTIADNDAGSDGGGIYLYRSTWSVSNCRIRNNRCASNGGGVYHDYFSAPQYTNCLIARNRAPSGRGGGVYNYNNSEPVLRNCTVCDNAAGLGGGGLYNNPGLRPHVENVIIYGNSPSSIEGGSPTVRYSCVEGGWVGEGNFSNAPSLTGSYWLKDGSRCIDAGSSNGPLLDMRGQVRWNHPVLSNGVGIIDIGILEFMDTDGDGMNDLWELLFFGDLSHDGTGDGENGGAGDGLTDLEEHQAGTSPTSTDTDGDGVSDFDEIHTHNTSPSNPDSDGDGMKDGWELDHGFDPNDPSDADGDPDNDNLTNAEEHGLGTHPRKDDTDDDGMPDDYEKQHNLNPLVDDSDEDPDGDDLSNGEEHAHGTDPNKYDTDGDGLPDGLETRVPQWNPLVPDDPNVPDDGDGLDGLEEATHGTDPTKRDTDGDGVPDDVEVDQGSDPTDAADRGVPPPPDMIADVRLTVGDHSYYPTELYNMTVGRITHIVEELDDDNGHGVPLVDYYKFARGHTYPVRIIHTRTFARWPPKPDYEYFADIMGEGWNHGVVVDDPNDLLGTHEERWFFWGWEARAKMHVVNMDLDGDFNYDGTVVGDPDDDKEHTVPGLGVRLNDNDDDTNNIPDFLDEPNLWEKDLVLVYLKGLPEDMAVGKVILHVIPEAEGQIKLWETKTKHGRRPGTPGLVLDSSMLTEQDEEWELGDDVTMADIDLDFYVEGTHLSSRPGDIILEVLVEDEHSVVVFSDRIRITVTKLDLDVDTDRDGDVEDNDEDEEDEDDWTKDKGAIFNVNFDRDGDNTSATGEPRPDAVHFDDRGDPVDEDYVIENAEDEEDIAELVIRSISHEIPDAWKVWLTVPEQEDIQRIHVYKKIEADPANTAIWGTMSGGGAPPPDDVELDITEWVDPASPDFQGDASGDCTFGIEGLCFRNTGAGVLTNHFDGEIDLTIELRDGTTVICSDAVRLKVAPWIMLSRQEASKEVWALDHGARNDEFRLNAAADTNYYGLGDSDQLMTATLPAAGTQWFQDHIEIGFTQRPGGPTNHVVFRLPYARRGSPPQPAWPLEKLLTNNVGTFQLGVDAGATYKSGDYGGNLEILPPDNTYKLGRMVLGDSDATSDRLRRFLESQEVQSVVTNVPVNWLAVAHIDEITSFLSEGTVAIADPTMAWDLLTALPPERLSNSVFFATGAPPVAGIASGDPPAGVSNRVVTGIDHTAPGAPNWKFIRIYDDSASGSGAAGTVGVVDALGNGFVTVSQVWYTSTNIINGGVITNRLTYDIYSMGHDAAPQTFTNWFGGGPRTGDRYVLCEGSRRWRLTMPAIVTATEVLGDTDFAHLNTNIVQGLINQASNRLEAASTPLTFTRVPCLFFGRLSGANVENHSAAAFNPGPTNLQPLDGRLYVPRQFGPVGPGGNDIYEAAIRAALGGTVRFVDCWDLYHRNMGEIHCGSNVKRELLDLDWWENQP